ncbi:MAG: ZIP family metal transporter [Tistlia sp.]|uniref:ZIP family metal transporter n=1 Tax=Tistlia sp. TaxID=3057121 RepID=UPI0034A290E0
MEVVLRGGLASLLAGLGTGVGAFAIFFLRRMSPALETTLLSLAAGIMLAAAAFSLLLPGLEVAELRGYGESGAAIVMALSVLAGGGLFWVANRFVPHEHFVKGREGPGGPDAVTSRRLWLFIIAICLHNFPEGLAVGAGFGQDDLGASIALTVGIAIQNMPEGFVVAAALVALNYGVRLSFWLALLTGLIEPVGGILGAAAVALVQPALPWALGLAAGAMIFVVAGEMIPETHRKGFESRATLGLLCGFALMLLLDGLL